MAWCCRIRESEVGRSLVIVPRGRVRQGDYTSLRGASNRGTQVTLDDDMLYGFGGLEIRVNLQPRV